MTEQNAGPAVLTSGLRKAYGEATVLDGIDLAIPAGTIFALLGPNGAGKTTTVQILSTLIAASAGSARVAGHDVRTEAGLVRAAIGVTGQFSAVDKLLTGKENLLLMADLAHLDKGEGRRRAAELLELFELTDAAGKPVLTYSGGMQRRLDLAMTLMLRPRILFLDEPTTGLDPRGRRRMWQIVRDLVGAGTTVFLTTQYLEEADQLADRIAMLAGGRIVAEGIINRFRTMAIARVSVLTGHVLGSVIQTMTGAVLVTAIAVGLGFRPAAGPAGWLGAIALIVVLAFACTWVSVALGLLAKNPEGASNNPLPLTFLPFISSAFVPAQAMAPGLRAFAEYQPFTPVTDTMRALLTASPGAMLPVAYAWCAGLALAGYLGPRALFNRGAVAQ